MASLTFLLLGSVLVLILVLLHSPKVAALIKLVPWPDISTWLRQPESDDPRKKKIDDIKGMAEYHEVARLMSDLINTEGAGSWPPNANHIRSTWPAALRAYQEIYLELAPLLSQETASLDDDVNIARIAGFRSRFRELLQERVVLADVMILLRAAEAGRWDVVPRDVYNAVYSCIACSRHAYRWATIPVVRVAQLEKEVNLPIELVEPWTSMQRHFGCPSESGNNTSNVVLNFDTNGTRTYNVSIGMSEKITSGEDAFFRMFYDIEKLAVPIYLDMIHAIVTFARDDRAACARHVASIAAQMRLILGSYIDNMHDKIIGRSIWLSYIQGFQGWGVGHYDQDNDEWVTYDGLSGNQVLLFQALDAFLGIEQYLSQRDQDRNLPQKQRELCHALKRHSFRGMLSETSGDPDEVEIMRNFSEIVKRLRLFRAAHRTRAKVYLSQAAPERLPMTAGKSLLGPTSEQSIAVLDEFMVRRIAQTV